jgi:16S rRNA (adenine1518-N6/adenine1519-N6)-dimethyltransferase
VYKPSEIQKFFKNAKTFPKKSLSQNFLIDKNIIKKIINSSNIQKDDLILEIGPGLGALTKEFLSKNIKILAIEKDKKFSNYLKNLKNPKLEIFEEDFLKFPLKKEISKRLTTKKHAKVLANLPYNISTPIIIKLLQNSFLFSKITLTLQYELAKRITAKENSKEFGSITVFVNFYSQPKLLFKISPNSFFPKPKVTSAVIQLNIKKDIPYQDAEEFHKFTRKTFQKRRKKLTTSLKEEFELEEIKKAFSTLKIDINSRPENLSFLQFYKLFKLLKF